MNTSHKTTRAETLATWSTDNGTITARYSQTTGLTIEHNGQLAGACMRTKTAMALVNSIAGTMLWC